MKTKHFFLFSGLLIVFSLSVSSFPCVVSAFGTGNNYSVGWYHYIGAASRLKERIADANANTVVAWPATFDTTSAKSFLDTAQANGIRVAMSVVGNPGQTAAENFINGLFATQQG